MFSPSSTTAIYSVEKNMQRKQLNKIEQYFGYFNAVASPAPGRVQGPTHDWAMF